MSEVAAVIPLSYMHLLAARVAESVEPTSIIKPARFDHQRIALPFADRVSHPGRLGIFGQSAPIGIDLAGMRVEFLQQNNLLTRLDFLERQYEHVRGAAVLKTLDMSLEKLCIP